MRRQTASSGGISGMRDYRDPGGKIAGDGRKVQGRWVRQGNKRQRRKNIFIQAYVEILKYFPHLSYNTVEKSPVTPHFFSVASKVSDFLECDLTLIYELFKYKKNAPNSWDEPVFCLHITDNLAKKQFKTVFLGIVLVAACHKNIIWWKLPKIKQSVSYKIIFLQHQSPHKDISWKLDISLREKKKKCQAWKTTANEQ